LGQLADNVISNTAYRADATQAIKWYRKAQSAGVSEANDALNALKRYYEDKARSGDSNARRLLLLWR
jgi:TPR repeat protein